MTTRYQRLRQAVEHLAASAADQIRHLDDSFAPLTGGGSAGAYGNNELALELEDIFLAANDMIEHDELTEAEKESVRPLYELLGKWSGQKNTDFWRREALLDDVRWSEVRDCAAEALARLPNEERAIGRSD